MMLVTTQLLNVCLKTACLMHETVLKYQTKVLISHRAADLPLCLRICKNMFSYEAAHSIGNYDIIGHPENVEAWRKSWNNGAAKLLICRCVFQVINIVNQEILSIFNIFTVLLHRPSKHISVDENALPANKLFLNKESNLSISRENCHPMIVIDTNNVCKNAFDWMFYSRSGQSYLLLFIMFPRCVSFN